MTEKIKKMFLKKVFINKLTAVFVAVGVILSASGIDGFALPATLPLNSVYPAYVESAVPLNLGKVTSSADFSTSKVIVHIQDLHGDPQTQKNIASILSFLDKKYGISDIYVEGAPKGRLSTKWLAGISDNSMKKAFINTMMSGGELSGAEYYSVTDGKTDILNGMENFDAYSENLVRLGEMKKNQSVVEAQLLPLRMKIEALGKKNYGRDNKKILALSRKYKKNEITSEKYFGTLFKLAGFWGDKYMVDWRSFAIGFAFLALIMGAFTFVVIIPASMQADSVETAILYHVQEIANHLVTMIFLGAAIVTALLDIGDQLKRKA